MFFILSKIFLYLLYPLLWVLLFFTIGLLTKKPRRKRNCFFSSLVLLIVFSNPFLLHEYAKFWDAKPVTLPAATNYSAAIILGGFVSEDANKDGYFNMAADRFIQGVKLKNEGKISHILISGGNAKLRPTDFKESDWVLGQLKEFKIPDSDILIENRSRNSYENAKFSKILLDRAHLQPPYILVTSAFHMRRALYIYKKMGVDVIPFPCNYIEGKNALSLNDFIPSSSTLTNWEFYTKELVGYATYTLFKK